MSAWLEDLDIDEISFVDKGASGNDSVRPKVVLFKRAGVDGDGEPTGFRLKLIQPSWLDHLTNLFRKSLEEAGVPAPPSVAKQEIKKMDLNAIMAAIKALSPEDLASIKAHLGGGEKPPAPPEPAAKSAAEIAKAALASLPEELRKKIEKDEAEKVEMQKRLAVLEDERDTAVFVAKAKALASLPGMSTGDMAKVLKSASKGLSADEFSALEKSLKSAAEAVKKSAVFSERGSTQAVDGSALSQVGVIVKALREKDPTLSKQKAELLAFESNPELYAAAKAEQNEAR